MLCYSYGADNKMFRFTGATYIVLGASYTSKTPPRKAPLTVPETRREEISNRSVRNVALRGTCLSLCVCVVQSAQSAHTKSVYSLDH